MIKLLLKEPRRSGEVVTRRSAKPLFMGSIPICASKFVKQIWRLKDNLSEARISLCLQKRSKASFLED
jgi:hypothetical protein